MYAVSTEVPAPAEVYDTLHAELLRRTGGSAEGLLVHIGRSIDGGFQVIEVWESREQFQRYNEQVSSVAAELFPGAMPATGPAIDEFDLRGLLIPAAKIFQ